MEDLLKHAFDTTLVGLFAVLCYVGLLLACLPRAYTAIGQIDSDKRFARAGLVLLPLAYMVGSVSFALGDKLFNEPPYREVWAAEWLTRPFGLTIQEDRLIRYEVYRESQDAACRVVVPASSSAMRARDELCTHKWIEEPQANASRDEQARLDSLRGEASDRLKPLYTYQKYRLLGDTQAAAELHDIREHLVILRGAAAHGYAILWLAGVGAGVAIFVALLMSHRLAATRSAAALAVASFSARVRHALGRALRSAGDGR
jgi:hypothetical protein